MEIPSIIHSSVYHEPSIYHAQKTFNFWLEFYVGGIRRYDVYYPDGKLFFSAGPDRSPELVLYMPGCSIYHEYSRKRENWMVIFSHPDLHFERETRKLYLSDGKFRSLLTCRKAVPPAEVEIVKNQIMELSDCFKMGIPGSKLLAGSILSNILLRHFILPSSGGRLSPAAKFKQMIDSNIGEERTLDELAAQCGYSLDFLRKKFLQEFHVLPGRYQDNRRIQEIMRKIIYTDLSLKEIAASTGISHTSYLNRLLKEYCGKSPGELCRIYRGVSF